MNEIILKGRKIFGGIIEGKALISSQGISFFGGVDPLTGIITESGHDLEGQSISNKILVFPQGKGSTVGSYALYRMKKEGTAPLAIINKECETIVAVGVIISEIPCIDKINISKIKNDQKLIVNGNLGLITLK